jgi:protein tyrosine phosphatase (PTP) superfamily phosphohydrolase (DUF442 family)
MSNKRGMKSRVNTFPNVGQAFQPDSQATQQNVRLESLTYFWHRNSVMIAIAVPYCWW